MKAIKHKNCIKFYENFETDFHHCVVMEYCNQGIQ